MKNYGKFLLAFMLFCLSPLAISIEPLVTSAAVDKAGISKDQLIKWSIDIVTTLYTYNFQNATQTVQNSHTYFTKKGFTEYQAALQSPQWFPIIARKKYDVLPILSDTPSILSEGVMEGAYTWSVQIPLVLYLRGPFDMTKQSKTIIIKIKRTALADSPSGLLVDGFELK